MWDPVLFVSGKISLPNNTFENPALVKISPSGCNAALWGSELSAR